jgi:hypothetical protein
LASASSVYWRMLELMCLFFGLVWEKVRQPGSASVLPGFFFGHLCGTGPYRLFNEPF